MNLDSYEKASIDILSYLSQDTTVLVLNSIIFRTIISAAAINRAHEFTALSFDYVDVLDYIPDIVKEIELTLPHPGKKDLSKVHFVTELIGQYGESWIPTTSPDYQKARHINFADDIHMVEWQRYLRAKLSTDIPELTILSVDPSSKVRDLAVKRLKTL